MTHCTQHKACKFKACEADYKNQLSPGAVADDEIILRSIFSPHHYDETSNTVLPNAFDCPIVGVSTHRLSYTSEAALHNFAASYLKVRSDRDANKAIIRSHIGVVDAIAKDLRHTIPYNDIEYRIMIFDSATQNNRSHAEIFACGPIVKRARQHLRAHLQKIFAVHPKQPADFFS